MTAPAFPFPQYSPRDRGKWLTYRAGCLVAKIEALQSAPLPNSKYGRKMRAASLHHARRDLTMLLLENPSFDIDALVNGPRETAAPAKAYA